MLRPLFVMCAILVICAAVAGTCFAAVPTLISYQGKLTDLAGQPVTGSYSMDFKLFATDTGGSPLWTEGKTVQAAGGLFTTALGSDVPLPSSILDGGSLYLEVVVEGTTLTPREQIVSSVFALRAGTVVDGAITDAKVADVSWGKLTGVPAGFADGVDDGASYAAGTGLMLSGNVFSLNTGYTSSLYWSITGNSGTTPGANFLGTSDNQALEIKVNGQRALRIEPTVSLTGNPSPNIIGGSPANTLASGVYGATISGGGMAGYTNRVTDIWGTVGGGWSNRVGDDAGAVTSAMQATVSGGMSNTASGTSSTVGGGQNNTASALGASVGGGVYNDATADYTTVAGGRGNEASGVHSTAAGGQANKASGGSSTVGGGDWNEATGAGSNVAGGGQNTAGGNYSTVGGGQGNYAGGQYAAVPGGYLNSAQGDYSFAAGRQASASHAGTFVWADSTGVGYLSTAADQFLIRASGGVGIGANDPQTALDVNGVIRARLGFRFPDGTTQTTAASPFSLPFAGSVSSAGSALSIANTGTGSAGSFEITNAGNPNAAAYGRTTGVGIAGRFEIANAGSSGSAVDGYTNGTGSGVQGRTSGSGSAIRGQTTGTGSAGYFAVSNTSNTNPAVHAQTTGAGPALQALGNYAAELLGNVHVSGNLGVGTISPTTTLDVNGVVRSAFGGFRFPDGTTQTTAATGLSLPYSGALSSASDGISVLNSGTGAAIRGETSSTSGSISAVVGRVTSTSPGGYSAGVRGINEGTAGSGIGVYGSQNGSGWGVYGFSVSGTGVRGDVSTGGWAGYFSGGASGNGVSISTAAGKIGLTVSGGTKNAVVATSTGPRLLYTEESTEVWFTDYGFGKLKDGRATIPIDPTFAETVSLHEPYHVFVQLRDADCDGVAVVNQTAASFDVVELRGGRSNAEFSYRIVARRKHYEKDRLEPAPHAGTDANLYQEKHDTLEARSADPAGKG